jgi:hypothetical protein
MPKQNLRTGIAGGLVFSTIVTVAQVFQPDPLSHVLPIGLVTFGAVLVVAVLAYRGRLR